MITQEMITVYQEPEPPAPECKYEFNPSLPKSHPERGYYKFENNWPYLNLKMAVTPIK